MQHEVDYQPPRRRPNHQPLRQRHPVVGLPQHYSSHNESHRRQRQHFQCKQ